MFDGSVLACLCTELLADLYYAQRERDSAMDERLANANQSLDIYQKELHKLAQARSVLFKILQVKASIEILLFFYWKIGKKYSCANPSVVFLYTCMCIE